MSESNTPIPEQKEIKENSKPNSIRRLAGGIIDICIIFLLYWGLYTLFMKTPMANHFNYLNEECQKIQDNIALETGFGEKITLDDENEEKYSSMIHYSDENGEYVVVTKEGYTKEEYNDYKVKLSEDTSYKNMSFDMQLINYGINCLSGTISLGVTILLIPLLNKKRGSIGDLASGQIVFSKKYQSYAKWYSIVIRYFFILLIDGALPFLFIEAWTFIAVPILIFIISLLSESGRSLHDLVSGIQKIDAMSFKPLVDL